MCTLAYVSGMATISASFFSYQFETFDNIVKPIKENVFRDHHNKSLKWRASKIVLSTCTEALCRLLMDGVLKKTLTLKLQCTAFAIATAAIRCSEPLIFQTWCVGVFPMLLTISTGS